MSHTRKTALNICLIKLITILIILLLKVFARHKILRIYTTRITEISKEIT